MLKFIDSGGGENMARLILIICVIASIMSISFIAPSMGAIEQENFAALYLFNESGGKTIRDSAGTRNNGEFQGSPKWSAGKFGFALEFNGKSDFVEVSPAKSLDITEQLTIVAWVNTRSVGEYRTFVSKGDAKSEIINYGVQFIDGGAYRFFTKPGDGYSFVDSKTPVSAGKWIHVGVTFDSVKNKLTFYIDGKLDATHDFPEDLKPSEKPLWIGKHIHLTLGDSQFWDGSLDELGILNVVLDETEIKEAMNGLQRFGDVSSSGKLTTTWGILKQLKIDD